MWREDGEWYNSGMASWYSRGYLLDDAEYFVALEVLDMALDGGVEDDVIDKLNGMIKEYESKNPVVE